MGNKLKLLIFVEVSLEYKLEESEYALPRVVQRRWICPEFKDKFISTRTLIFRACPVTKMATEERVQEYAITGGNPIWSSMLINNFNNKQLVNCDN